MDVSSVIDEIAGHVGLAKVISCLDGKGSSWLVMNTAGLDCVLKVRHPELSTDVGRIDRVQTVRNEARTLKQLLDRGFSDMFLGSGSCDGFEWVLMKRVTGTPSNLVAQAIRRSKKTRTLYEFRADFIDLFIVICRALTTLHATGFLHGDVQPAHFLIPWSGIGSSMGEAKLIDFELTRPFGDEAKDYPGGLIHFVSPGIAQAMLAGHPTQYTLMDEEYSFGATLFWLYSGHSIHNYGSKDYLSVPFEEKLARISEDARSTFDAVSAPPWPEMQSIIDSLLNRRACKSILEDATGELRELRASYLV